MDGDVWLAPEEINRVAFSLDLPIEQLKAERGRSFAGPTDSQWMSLKRGDVGPTDSQWMSLKRGDDEDSPSCTFLDESGQCSIYDVRPVQCRTYPFWPSLLEKKRNWLSEATLPDEVPLRRKKDRHWSIEKGGCEGINHVEAIPIPNHEVKIKTEIALSHWERFPDEEIKQTTWYL